MIQSAPIRRAIVLSTLAHFVVAVVGWWAFDERDHTEVSLIDIELAPVAPLAELLPKEIVRKVDQQQAQTTEEEPTREPTNFAIDAGIDAPPDAKIDAQIDAAPDAMAPMVANAAEGDADMPGGAIDQPGSKSGGGSGTSTGVLGREDIAAGSGSGSGSVTSNLPPVEGATSAGTASNLLPYFPGNQTVALMVRFDRLRGTEWAAQTERLMKPMPDYETLFGKTDAKIRDKLEAIIVATPQANNAIATTIVARTKLPRGPLRAFLGAINPVDWSTAKGGLLGKRRGSLYAGDGRVFLSPFRNWFILGWPNDLQGLSAVAPGDPDTIEASGKLPIWVEGIRKIEAESGDPDGPALVLTIGLEGKRRTLGDNDYGLGVKTFPMPDRLTVAAELVTQGWLVRGNLRFVNEAEAIEFVTAAGTARQRILDSRLLQAAIGNAPTNVIRRLTFVRSGARVAYGTSFSIADMRALMIVAAGYVDAHFAAVALKRRP